MYNDKGSGNRVSKEWRDKLKKLVDTYNSYMESVKNDKINEIDLKFRELESKLTRKGSNNENFLR